MNQILLYFTIKYKGNWENIYIALSEKEQVRTQDVKEIPQEDRNNYISIIDRDYPYNLQTIYKPAFSIFWKGDFKLFNNPNKTTICAADEFNKKELNNFINDKEYYSNNVFVVRLSDKELINELLTNDKKIIAISDSGLEKASDIDFINKLISKDNLVISEIPKDCPAIHKIKEQYVERLVAGLSKNVFVFGKENKSNKLIKSICKLEDIPFKNISNFNNQSWNFSNDSNSKSSNNQELKKTKS